MRGLDVEHAKQLRLLAVRLVQWAEDLGGVGRDARIVEQRLERLTARRVGGIERQRLAARFDRTRDVRQLLAPHGLETTEEREAIDERVGEAELGFERLGDVRPALGQLVEHRQRRQRRAVGAKVVDDGAISEDRLVDVDELFGERGRSSHHERLARVTVGRMPLSDAEDLDE